MAHNVAAVAVSERSPYPHPAAPAEASRTPFKWRNAALPRRVSAVVTPHAKHLSENHGRSADDAKTRTSTHRARRPSAATA